MEKEILKKFKRHPEKFLSGEEMSGALHISRAALWKHMEKLREMGYIIEAMPRHGYMLKEIPDRLYPDEVSFNLQTKLFGREIVYRDTVDSTNTLCSELALQGRPEGTIVLAEEQTRGKGRMSRQWMSPKYGGIYMSIILRPNIIPLIAPQLTLISAVSAANALREFCKADVSIKWPNDILLDGKKLAGILTEMNAESDRINFIILGIGINVNSKKIDLPDIATSLFESFKRSYSRIKILQNILFNFERDYNDFLKDGFLHFRERWNELSSTLYRRVRVKCMNREFEGEVKAIDIDGALIVKLQNGKDEKVISGDIFFLN